MQNDDIADTIIDDTISEENVADSPEKSKESIEIRRQRQREYWSKQLMLPEWMNDIPNDLAQNVKTNKHDNHGCSNALRSPPLTTFYFMLYSYFNLLFVADLLIFFCWCCVSGM